MRKYLPEQFELCTKDLDKNICVALNRSEMNTIRSFSSSAREATRLNISYVEEERENMANIDDKLKKVLK